MKQTINNIRVFDGEKLSSLTNVFIENGYISSKGNELFEADETPYIKPTNFEMFLADANLPEEVKEMIAHVNAEKLYKLYSSEKIRGGKLRKITYIDGRVAKME